MATTDNQVGRIPPVRSNNVQPLLPTSSSSSTFCRSGIIGGGGAIRSSFYYAQSDRNNETNDRIEEKFNAQFDKLTPLNSFQLTTPVTHQDCRVGAQQNKQLGSLIAADLELLRLRDLRLNEQQQQAFRSPVKVLGSPSSPFAARTWPTKGQSQPKRLITEPLTVSLHPDKQQKMHNNNTDHHHPSNRHQLSHLNLSHPIQGYHYQPSGEFFFGYGCGVAGTDYTSSFTTYSSDPSVEFAVQQTTGELDGNSSSITGNQQQQQQHYQVSASPSGFEMAESVVGRTQQHYTSLHHPSIDRDRSTGSSCELVSGTSSSFNQGTTTCELLIGGLGQQECSHSIDSNYNPQPHPTSANSSSTASFQPDNSGHHSDPPPSYANLEPATQQLCLCQRQHSDGSKNHTCRLVSDESILEGPEEASSDLVPDSVFQLNYPLISNSNSHQLLQPEQAESQQHRNSDEVSSLTELNSRAAESSGCCQLELLSSSYRSNQSTGCASTLTAATHLVTHSSSQVDLNVIGNVTGDDYDSLEPELKVCEWDNCGNTFLDILEFVKHLEERHVNQEPREKNRYYCLWSNCKRNEQEFNARYKLLIHMRVHSGEKPYPCNIQNCNKSFSRLENLKIHQRSHTGEKPYKCNFEGCSKSFTNSSDRIKHHKTHRDPKPYSCNYSACLKRYTDPSSLRKHLRVHKRAEQNQQQQQQLQQQQQFQVNQSELAQHSAYSSSSCAILSQPGAPMQLQQPQSFSTSHQSGQLFKSLNAPTPREAGLTSYLAPESDSTQAHAHLSRSWCAGSSSRTDAAAGLLNSSSFERSARGYWAHQSATLEPSWRQPINASSQHSIFGAHLSQVDVATFASDQNQNQQHFFPASASAVQQIQQMTTNHETLMRSLPAIRGFQMPGAPQ